ncbi:MAG: hypothetical protein LBT59_28735 [Clostridiales bacterium]|jgi:hypothetical protein|nr:hypothetical protein [Clostridiales bacterium]
MKTFKLAAIFAACLALTATLATTVLSAEFAGQTKDGEKTAIPTLATLYLSNVEHRVSAYVVDGHSYFSLRDLASILSGSSKCFSVTWNADKNEIALVTGEVYEGSVNTVQEIFAKPAKPAIVNLTLDWRPVNLKGYTIDGKNFYRLDDLAEALDFGITWNRDIATLKPFLRYNLTVEYWDMDDAVAIPIPTTIPEDAIPSFLN